MISIRPATPAERKRFRDQWARTVRAPGHEVSQRLGRNAMISLGKFVKTGPPGHYIAPSLLRRALEAEIDRMMDRCDVLVADLVTVPGEPLGWCAFEGERLHFVHVLGPARMKGIGRALVQASGTNKATYLTEAGKALLASASGLSASQMRADDAERSVVD